MNKAKAVQFSLIIILLSLFAYVFSHQSYQAYEHSDSLKIWILDVGQGDSILIDTPQEQQILIDGGPDGSVLTELQKAMPATDKEINLIISTHNDADHLSGINSVLEHYKVDKIIDSGATNTTATYKKFLQLVSDNNIPVEVARIGTAINFGELKGVVISPSKNYIGVQPQEQNIASVVTFWQYGQETFLEEGDAQAQQEAEMMNNGLVRHADILKVAHHGSATSSTEDFLKALSPKLAVISVGKNNKYNLPNPGVIERFKYLNIPILRTDEKGTIEISVFLDHFSY